MLSKGLSLAASVVVTAALVNWTAVLDGVDGSRLNGTASVEAISPDSMSATVTITGAKDGSVHPWMVHHGTCGGNGAVYGNAASYPAIKVGSDGTGQSTAQLAVAAPSEGDYSVHVHRSASDLTVIACGALKPDAGAAMPRDTLKQPTDSTAGTMPR